MSRSLDHLCPRFRPLAFELIARCAGRKVWLIVVDTLRTPEEQAEYLKTGASRTSNSLHLPQVNCPHCGLTTKSGRVPGGFKGLSHAMDAAPILDLDATSAVKAIQWDVKHPSWKVYGEEAKRLGLVWGGDWGWDFSHVQMPRTEYTSGQPSLAGHEKETT